MMVLFFFFIFDCFDGTKQSTGCSSYEYILAPVHHTLMISPRFLLVQKITLRYQTLCTNAPIDDEPLRPETCRSFVKIS